MIVEIVESCAGSLDWVSLREILRMRCLNRNMFVGFTYKIVFTLKLVRRIPDVRDFWLHLGFRDVIVDDDRW